MLKLRNALNEATFSEVSVEMVDVDEVISSGIWEMESLCVRADGERDSANWVLEDVFEDVVKLMPVMPVKVVKLMPVMDGLVDRDVGVLLLYGGVTGGLVVALCVAV